MTKRNVSTGFEKNFVESWEGWDLLDTTAFIFYKANLTDALGLPTDKLYDVAIDLDKLIVEVYDLVDGEGETKIVATRHFELKLKD